MAIYENKSFCNPECNLLHIFGLDVIPRNLLFPLDDVDWEEPFNNFYKMVTREGLEDATSEIVFNESAVDKNIEIIRDGKTDQIYNSTKIGDSREVDFYGYKWKKPIEIAALSYNNGVPSEFCGWFTSFDVEYYENGKWVKMETLSMTPEMNLDNTQWLKPNFIDYEISFEPVKTTGIRIIGLSGGIPKDAGNAHLGMQYYTTISELRVYSE